MKVNSISIVPQNVGCNYKCKYCIAHMTCNVRKGLSKPGISLPKLEKCLKYAKDFGASTAIITSCGETLLGSWTNIENILWLCKKYFGQIDLHTNGSEIMSPPKYGRDFAQMLAPYFSNVTMTVAHYDRDKNVQLMGQSLDYTALLEHLNNLGLSVRLSCVVCEEGINSPEEIRKYIDYYRERGVSQVVFRELWIPKNAEETITKWCEDNQIFQDKITQSIETLANTYHCKPLNIWGKQPYDFDGVAVSSSTCTQNNTNETVKSLVYRPDNFMYPDWDSRFKMM